MSFIKNGNVYTPQGLGAPIFMNDAAIGSGMAFLTGELEKRDPRLLEPLTSVTWARDIVAKTGGGWADFTSNYFVDYATSGGAAGGSGIIGGATNDIPIVQANMSKDVWRVFNFSNILRIPFVDQAKLREAGRSLDDILDDGIRLNYNKSIDNVVYTGIPDIGIYGLVNNPNLIATTAPVGTGGSAAWKTKDPDEILDDVNSIINSTWAESEYDLTGMANHILIPPVQYTYLTGRKVSAAGTDSILKFLLENNIGKNQGVELFIGPSRWCAGAGIGGTDRMVAYVNDDKRVNFDLPVPLTRVMTQPDVKEMAFMTGYTAQLGQVKFLYEQCARYMDGI